MLYIRKSVIKTSNNSQDCTLWIFFISNSSFNFILHPCVAVKMLVWYANNFDYGPFGSGLFEGLFGSLIWTNLLTTKVKRLSHKIQISCLSKHTPCIMSLSTLFLIFKTCFLSCLTLYSCFFFFFFCIMIDYSISNLEPSNRKNKLK